MDVNLLKNNLIEIADAANKLKQELDQVDNKYCINPSFYFQMMRDLNKLSCLTNATKTLDWPKQLPVSKEFFDEVTLMIFNNVDLEDILHRAYSVGMNSQEVSDFINEGIGEQIIIAKIYAGEIEMVVRD